MKAISLPFSFSNSGGISYSEDPQKIWQDRVVLVVMTIFGERVMRPSFGSDAKYGSFENVDDAIVMTKQTVASAFFTWLQELNFVDLTGSIEPSDQSLVLLVSYKVGTGDQIYTTKVKTSVFSRAGELILEVSNG
jgi:phage baseplate assembly protein W